MHGGEPDRWDAYVRSLFGAVDTGGVVDRARPFAVAAVDADRVLGIDDGRGALARLLSVGATRPSRLHVVVGADDMASLRGPAPDLTMWVSWAFFLGSVPDAPGWLTAAQADITERLAPHEALLVGPYQADAMLVDCADG